MYSLKTFKSKSFIKFVFFGFLITLLSNTSLILILLILPLSLATFLSQVLHAYLGFLANKYGVFKRKGNPIAYIFLVIISWFIQWFLIKFIGMLGISSTLAVLVAIPFLATFSFFAQKFIVFK